jgi:hypothetical protein
MTKKILICVCAILLVYLGLSYLVLNGQLTYTTSFCSSDKENSKYRNLFVSDDKAILRYDTTNEPLKRVIAKNDIWLEKHYNVRYYGALFHWTSEDPEFYKIRMEKIASTDSGNLVCSLTRGNETIEKAIGFPYRQVAFRRGSVVNFNISDYREHETHPIGTLTVLVQ